jgi:formylglycine-generating enzyme required for sulfatase activity
VPWLIDADGLAEHGGPRAAYRCRRLTNSLGMQLALIPPGRSVTGSPSREGGRGSEEGPQHEVPIMRPFCLGVDQVAHEEYQRSRGHNPSHLSRSGGGQDTGRFPVATVARDGAVELCRRPSESPEAERAGGLDCLPTEAQWEDSGGGGARASQPFSFRQPFSSLCFAPPNFHGNHLSGGAPDRRRQRRAQLVRPV